MEVCASTHGSDRSRGIGCPGQRPLQLFFQLCVLDRQPRHPRRGLGTRSGWRQHAAIGTAAEAAAPPDSRSTEEMNPI